MELFKWIGGRIDELIQWLMSFSVKDFLMLVGIIAIIIWIIIIIRKRRY